HQDLSAQRRPIYRSSSGRERQYGRCDLAHRADLASREAIDCRASLHEYERGSRAGLLRRWHGGGNHYCAVALQLALRDRPQLVVTYKGKPVDVRQVGRELGVRYVMEGSVRRAGERLRILGQLVDATTGAQIWADRFDGELKDVFDVQDRITESVVAAIEPWLQLAEIERVKRKAPADLAAYDFLLQAQQLEYEFTAASLAAALRCLDRALAIEPSYAR